MTFASARISGVAPKENQKSRSQAPKTFPSLLVQMRTRRDRLANLLLSESVRRHAGFVVSSPLNRFYIDQPQIERSSTG